MAKKAFLAAFLVTAGALIAVLMGNLRATSAVYRSAIGFEPLKGMKFSMPQPDPQVLGVLTTIPTVPNTLPNSPTVPQSVTPQPSTVSGGNTTPQSPSSVKPGKLTGYVYTKPPTSIFQKYNIEIQIYQGSAIVKTVKTNKGSFSVELPPGSYTVIPPVDVRTGFTTENQNVVVKTGETTSVFIIYTYAGASSR